jgi:hypothetical protein
LDLDDLQQEPVTKEKAPVTAGAHFSIRVFYWNSNRLVKEKL